MLGKTEMLKPAGATLCEACVDGASATPNNTPTLMRKSRHPHGMQTRTDDERVAAILKTKCHATCFCCSNTGGYEDRIQSVTVLILDRPKRRVGAG
jgi:hypothetical protein